MEKPTTQNQSIGHTITKEKDYKVPSIYIDVFA